MELSGRARPPRRRHNVGAGRRAATPHSTERPGRVATESGRRGQLGTPRLEDLFRRRFDDLRHLAFLATGSGDVADDLVQEVFLQAVRRVNADSDVVITYPYLLNSLRHRVADWSRRRSAARRALERYERESRVEERERESIHRSRTARSLVRAWPRHCSTRPWVASPINNKPPSSSSHSQV